MPNPGSIPAGSTFNDIVERQWQVIEDRKGIGLTGLLTGLADIDCMMNGLHDGDLMLVISRPGMGRTTFMLSVVSHLAIDRKTPVGVILRTNDDAQQVEVRIIRRLLAMRSGVSIEKIMTNRLTRDDFAALQTAKAQLMNAPIHMKIHPATDHCGWQEVAKELVSVHGAKAIFVDHFDRFAPYPGQLPEEWHDSVPCCKWLARAMKVPLICLVNYSVRQEGMASVPKGMEWAEDADVLLTLHREEMDHVGNEEWAVCHPEKREMAEILVARNRRGPVGVARLQFCGETSSFHDRFRHHDG